MLTTRYDVNNYNSISLEGYDYRLPSAILSIIIKLTNELGIIAQPPVRTNAASTSSEEWEPATNYKRTPMKRNKSNSKMREMNDETWTSTRGFKVTKIEKKEGMDKIINDIRVCLNKISTKNYDIQKDSAFLLINNLIDNDSDGEHPSDEDEGKLSASDNVTKIANVIFDIASANKVHSELYARLYKELTQKFDIFGEIIRNIVDQYLIGITTIECVDQNVDYDKFCNNNKLNDKRKAMALFIVNLMKQDIIGDKEVGRIVITLLELVISYKDSSERLPEVDEITENIFVFMTSANLELKTLSNWEDILNIIKQCSQYKSRDCLGISSRAIFKYMDMLDYTKSHSN
jgi:hypothetical protein